VLATGYYHVSATVLQLVMMMDDALAHACHQGEQQMQQRGGLHLTVISCGVLWVAASQALLFFDQSCFLRCSTIQATFLSLFCFCWLAQLLCCTLYEAALHSAQASPGNRLHCMLLQVTRPWRRPS
jgi:hypothetical protein